MPCHVCLTSPRLAVHPPASYALPASLAAGCRGVLSPQRQQFNPLAFIDGGGSPSAAPAAPRAAPVPSSAQQHQYRPPQGFPQQQQERQHAPTGRAVYRSQSLPYNGPPMGQQPAPQYRPPPQYQQQQQQQQQRTGFQQPLPRPSQHHQQQHHQQQYQHPQQQQQQQLAQPPPQPPPQQQQFPANAIIVSKRQEGNPVLRCIRCGE